MHNISNNISNNFLDSSDHFDYFTDYATYYLSRKKNELYCALGNSLLEKSILSEKSAKIDVNPFDTTNFLSYKKGKTYMKSIKEKINLFVCKEWKFCEKLEAYQSDVELAIDISQILASKISGVPIFAVSALIVKQGAHEFCNCHK
ncbi:hypothetical protein F7734_26135 [Scytonema sp. UIC 10036]|uniref:hypothetical protein n=1 Tax=Scytonema sp. UIC 10036 TaxID=2304196 RepID=UPI0012DADCB6|nr:hypothetical protein [Scytonema sp. UIC 10036]MUG95648.1 hypothetical protein [Scytonema sp. UIC 10036]